MTSESVCPRTTRATAGQPKNPITSTTSSGFGNEVGTTAVSAIMNTSDGNPKMTSTTRDSTRSYQPPRNPVVTPTSTPITIDIAVAASPMPSDVRAP
ncbi:hypothetical protein GCM10017712_03550 [Curtobacterium citreum]